MGSWSQYHLSVSDTIDRQKALAEWSSLCLPPRAMGHEIESHQDIGCTYLSDLKKLTDKNGKGQILSLKEMVLLYVYATEREGQSLFIVLCRKTFDMGKLFIHK
jgi:hypothetical protein